MISVDPYKYNIVVQKVAVDDDEFFEATVRELPDIHEYSDSYQGAYMLAIDTIKTAAEMYESEGRVFPAHMEKQNEFSGRVTLRITKSMHESLNTWASYEGVSLNQYIVSLIAMGLGKQVAAPHFPKSVFVTRQLDKRDEASAAGYSRVIPLDTQRRCAANGT